MQITHFTVAGQTIWRNGSKHIIREKEPSTPIPESQGFWNWCTWLFFPNYEEFETKEEAMRREAAIKKMAKADKLKLIETKKPL